ncbi:ABC transporter permease [candidate division KSB1 bacterium]|nr:ABC transporter permease [candidate division KSB1 bacterium]
MSKILAIIQREYVSRARTKGFIIGTLIFPLMIVMFLGGVFLFGVIFQPTTKSFVVIDQSTIVYPEFVNILSDTLKGGAPKYRFTEQKVGDEGLDAVMEQCQQQVRDKQIDGYLIIPPDIVESRTVKYSARNVSDFEEHQEIQQALSRIVGNYTLTQQGYPAEDIREALWENRISLVSAQVTAEGEVKKSGESSFALTYLLTYIMFLMMMIYGAMVTRSVIEEKSQRITETIISAVRPWQLMVGKIIGICALGLTQLIIVGIIFLMLLTYASPLLMNIGVTSPDVIEFAEQTHFTAQVFVFMIVFFILGFVLYSTLYAGLGAIVNSEDEGQQNQMPIVFIIIISFLIMFSVAKNPDTPMALWTSLIPLFTPIVMFARVAVSDPMLPSGSIVSIGIMLTFNALLILLIGRIYRVGILMYGKRPSLKEAIKWVRYK